MVAFRAEDTCPKCGSHLMVREGEYGDFLACPRFPACKYTKPLPEDFLNGKATLTEAGIKEYRKPSPYCKKCNHTGLLPFIKGERAISNAYLWCDCKIEIESQEYYAQLKTEDFDYPMSALFREHSFEYCGIPGSEKAMTPKEEEIPKVVISEKPWNKNQYDRVEQLRREFLNVLGKFLDLEKLVTSKGYKPRYK